MLYNSHKDKVCVSSGTGLRRSTWTKRSYMGCCCCSTWQRL